MEKDEKWKSDDKHADGDDFEQSRWTHGGSLWFEAVVVEAVTIDKTHIDEIQNQPRRRPPVTDSPEPA